MKLNEQGIKEKKQWEAAGYRLPEFDRQKMITAKKKRKSILDSFWRRKPFSRFSGQCGAEAFK